MERIKEILGMAAVTLLFSLFTWALVSSYLEEYDLRSAKPQTVTVSEKIGEKGLFTPPAYYVRVRLPSGNLQSEANRISKKQMQQVERGDTIDGYMTGPSTFSTVHDIVIDSFFYLVGILALGFIAFCCLIATVFTILAASNWGKQPAAKKRKEKRRKSKRKEKSRREQENSGWRIAASVVLIFLLAAGRFLMNLVRKLVPFGKTKTEALIMEGTSHFSFRRYEDSSYQFSLAFVDEDGNLIQAIKDVTRHTYAQYGIGDRLQIAYDKSNPYDIFVPGTSIWDLFQLAITWQMLLYSSILAVSVFVCWAFYDSRLKGKWRKPKETYKK